MNRNRAKNLSRTFGFGVALKAFADFFRMPEPASCSFSGSRRACFLALQKTRPIPRQRKFLYSGHRVIDRIRESICRVYETTDTERILSLNRRFSAFVCSLPYPQATRWFGFYL
jgi:hypothetical protein